MRVFDYSTYFTGKLITFAINPLPLLCLLFIDTGVELLQDSQPHSLTEVQGPLALDLLSFV
jgi:hypothetical protein